MPQEERQPKKQPETPPEVPTTRELQAEIARLKAELKRQIADNAAAIANAPLRGMRLPESSNPASANPSPVLERGGAYAHRELAQAKGGQEQALWEEEAPAAPVVRKIGAGKERKR